jgi:glutathione synthase/RimK-type ligase-like ATP-grasp enzyme
MNKTLLVIGDNKDWDSFLKFYRYRHLLKKYNFYFKSTDYNSILKDNFPLVKTKKLIIFLFFPFKYWDKYIEPKNYKGVYGNKDFYLKFKKFWTIIDKKIKKRYKDKKIYFINPPENLSIDRDKELTKKLIKKGGPKTPKTYNIRDINKILELLSKGKKFFIKVRYGSMGKGITYLEKDRWYTNFTFRNKKIWGRKSDYGWRFRDITNNKAFLKELLKEDVIIEEAINPLLIKMRKFDLRMYVCFDKVLYTYPRSNDADSITTNISQGAKGERPSFLKGIRKDLLKRAENNALKAIKSLGLNFGGVDIMLDSNEKDTIVIEINTFPGFPKMKRFNLPGQMIKEIGKRRWE